MATRDEPRSGQSGFKYALAGWLGAGLLRMLRCTWRVVETPGRVVQDRQRARAGGPGTIYLLWHSRIMLSAATQADQGAYVLISQHGDGEFIARAVERMGFRSIRGSSTRGGARALVQVIQVLRSGGDVAFTPDGPRGPRMRVQAGCVTAASRSGAAIVPVAFESSRVKRLRSWDRFMVPKPCARVHVLFGEPIVIPSGLTSDETETWRALVEERLVAATRAAAEEIGVVPETPDADPGTETVAGAAG